MFTGIIQYVGTVQSLESIPAGRRLMLEVGPLAQGLSAGGSIAVNGACLTAVQIVGAVAAFDVIVETLGLTTLGRLKAGVRVNLERALRLGDCLDGHMVLGHVDGQARVDRVDRTGGQYRLHLACDRPLTDEMVTKGSVAVDGVSLTLAELADGRFGVALIPTTLAQTTLGVLRVGDTVNVETDILGKYVRRSLGRPSEGAEPVTLETLRRAGFA
ncbi:MAG: riboflavin synthase [Planctomycetes bacterium]|nr:riboflavin synthase [Planctomycetota bacterium]